MLSPRATVLPPFQGAFLPNTVVGPPYFSPSTHRPMVLVFVAYTSSINPLTKLLAGLHGGRDFIIEGIMHFDKGIILDGKQDKDILGILLFGPSAVRNGIRRGELSFRLWCGRMGRVES